MSYGPVKVAPVTESTFYRHSGNYDGVCLACGKWQTGGCEPDARNYPCKRCKARQVHGAEQALIMGYLDIK